ncbi:response regulator transcription factor [Sulfurimonas sp. HSL1-2]|uniref:response regulator transcription factor n=1 Tax=Thiomicrolovo zhangzhouensis TaxID=3131933 RepID=UPI0031F7B8DE
MKNATILLLEDDTALHETLSEYLDEEGFEVVGCFDGESAEDQLYERSFDLLILDVNVPGKNGFEVLREARERGVETPALFLTTRDSAADAEQGFESGADDYVRKPFSLKELLLRVQSMLRRRFSHPASERMDLGGGLAFDLQNALLYDNGEPVKLAEKPRKLLELLLQRRGDVVTHEVINAHLWGFEETPSEEALRTYIKTIRSAVGKDRIISHKRTGYQFR